MAIATTSVSTHSASTTGRGKWSRMTSARFRPVAMPSLADSVWITIAITLAVTTTQTSW